MGFFFLLPFTAFFSVGSPCLCTYVSLSVCFSLLQHFLLYSPSSLDTSRWGDAVLGNRRQHVGLQGTQAAKGLLQAAFTQWVRGAPPARGSSSSENSRGLEALLGEIDALEAQLDQGERQLQAKLAAAMPRRITTEEEEEKEGGDGAGRAWREELAALKAHDAALGLEVRLDLIFAFSTHAAVLFLAQRTFTVMSLLFPPIFSSHPPTYPPT